MEFAAVIDVLRLCEQLRDLSLSQKGTLLLLARPTKLGAGDIVFREGDENTDRFVLLVSGALDVLADNNTRVVGSLEPGTLAGEVGMITTKHARTRTVKAARNSELLAWSCDEIARHDAALFGKLRSAFEDTAFQRLAQDI